MSDETIFKIVEVICLTVFIVVAMLIPAIMDNIDYKHKKLEHEKNKSEKKPKTKHRLKL